MSDAREPTRLTELATEAPELAAAIRSVRAEQAESAQLETLAQRLSPQLGGATLPATATGISVGAWAKALLGLTLIGLGAYIAAHRAHSEDERRPSVPPATEAMAASPPVAPREVVRDQPPPSTASEQTPPMPAPARAARSARQRTTTAPVQQTSSPTPEGELALLERARAELDHAPSATLALVAEHAQLYPRGLFVQEREVLAIEALLKRKQRSVARARAAAFVQEYPDSAHVRRVRGLLELVPAPPSTQPVQ